MITILRESSSDTISKNLEEDSLRLKKSGHSEIEYPSLTLALLKLNKESPRKAE